jgi:signal transduction histidine kinase/ActR/RegA family two-component response regulator
MATMLFDARKSRIPTAIAATVGFCVLGALAFQRTAPGSLLPHGYCFTWNPALLWTHVVSDGLIGAAYMSIPLTLLHLRRRRVDMPFNWVVLLFAVFILSCGATHWIEVWTVWNPDYWLSGNVKVLTAVASVLTAAALFRLVPTLLAIPTLTQLTAARDALQLEVTHRRAAEAALLRERAELETRVADRTCELARATADAEALRASAEQANALKDRFLAKVSHELRTPLQSTLGWAQMLSQAHLKPERAAHAAERIVHNVRTQARLIDDLLDISRILSGKLTLDMRPADTADVIAKAVEVARSASLPRPVDIALMMQTEGVATMTDPVRLEQVIVNLVNNAVHATPDGGRIEVRARVEGGSLCVEVADTGGGIERAEIDGIFEPFRQGQRSASSHRGLGLGLAITRNIVELFGGRITATSAGAGHGATFAFHIPVVATDTARPRLYDEVPLALAQRQRLQGLRVLFVEDEADIAEGTRHALAGLGMEVAVCLDLASAEARIAAGGFDVVLTDFDLGGGKTALDLMDALRAAPAVAGVPVVVLSAYGAAEDLARSAAAGACAHVVKPAGANQIAGVLAQALSLVVKP